MAVVPADLEAAGRPVRVDGRPGVRGRGVIASIVRRSSATGARRRTATDRRGDRAAGPSPVTGGRVCGRAILGGVSLEIDHVTKRFGTTIALDGLTFEVGARRGLRVPRRQRRGQDDDDADLPRDHRAGRRRDPLGRPPDGRAAAPDLGLPARGARALSADGRPRPAGLLRLAVRRAARSCAARGARLADPLPDPRVRGPASRGALEGQPAEGPVHRRRPPRPRGAADGRAVHRARPGQPRPPARGVHGAARPRPDADLLDPPDGGGRGDVRIGRDRRPRAAGRRRPRCATSSGPAAGGRCGSPLEGDPAPAWLAELPGVDGRPARRRAAPSSSCCPARIPPRSSRPSWPEARR